MKKLYALLILLCSIFTVGHAATPESVTGTVTFDYNTAYTNDDYTGYFLNKAPLRKTAATGLLNIPHELYRLSKKITVGYREYEVVLEFTNPSPAVSGSGFTIPSNSYQGTKINLQIGKGVEFKIYVLNSQGDVAGSITSIQFCSPASYRAAYYANLSLASNNGNETFADWNTSYYVKWWRPTDKTKNPIQKPHFIVGNATPNAYSNYGIEFEYIKVSFQTTDYEPFTPYIFPQGGHIPDATNTIHFINDIDVKLALQQEDANAGMDLFMHFAQPGDNRLVPPVDNDHRIANNSTVNISENASLWCYAANNASWSYHSGVNELNFEKIDAIEFPDIPSLTGVKKGEKPPVNNDYTRSMVTFTDSLLVDGVLLTDQHNYYNYFKDRKGNMIRVVSTDTLPGLRANQLIAPKGITGRYLHTQGTPEIDITGFEKYCAATDSNSSASRFPRAETRYSTELKPGEKLFDKDDFNKHLMLSYVKYCDGARIEDINGVSYPLYIRFLNYPIPDNIQPGDYLWMEGYIGKNGLEISFMPIDIQKCAPRPFVRYQTGNRISGETPVVSIDATHPITWTIDREDDISYSCLINYGDNITPASNWIEPRDITIADFTNKLPDGRLYCDLAVSANFGDRYDMTTSTVERIRFIKEEAIEVASIKDFKPLYYTGGIEVEGADYSKYYVITGDVVIEDASTSNLLVRDNVPESSDIKTGQQYHILIYNENGWSQPEISVIENGQRVTRSLKEGDVISSFVVRPELTSYDLFRGNATGFARTYTLADDVDEVTKESIRTVSMTYDPKDSESDTYYEKIKLDYWNILLPFKFENVAIGCRENPDYASAKVQSDGTRTDRDGNIVPQYIYQMVVGENLDIDFIAFPDRIGGFTTSYDINKFKAANGDVTKYPTYDINAIVIKNPYYGKHSEASQYAMALTDFGGVPTSAAPEKMYVEGFEDDEPNERGELEYPHEGIVKFSGVVAGSSVYYTTDGTDPKHNLSPLKYNENTGIKLTGDNLTTVIRAYAVNPGCLPSEEISETFRRQSVEVPYIMHFINIAKEGLPYHFSGITRIAEKDGDYMLIRGTEGNMLTIHRDRGVQTFATQRDADIWDSYEIGDYLTDFVITPELFDENNFARTAKVTDEHSQYLKSSEKSKPEGLAEDIDIDRYSIAHKVSRLNLSHIGQLVALNYVKLIQIGDENYSEMLLVPDYGNAVEDAMLVNDASLEFNLPKDVDIEHNYFNVIGVIMVDDDQEYEFWPIEIASIGITDAPTIECDENAVVTEDDFNNYTVDFYPHTVVTLKYTGKNAANASLRYIFTPEGETVDDNAKWNVYGQPFTVTNNGYIHVVAIVDGMEESAHTHVIFNRTEQSCDVDFVAVPLGNKSTISMLPAHDIEDGSYKILYSTDGTEPATEYTEPILIEENTTFLARLYEEGKAPGNVCRGVFHAGNGNNTNSQVTFSIVLDNDNNPLVQLSPREPLDKDSYSIYYTTSIDEIPAIKQGMLYIEPFPIPETRVVLAILVINHKIDGGVTTLNVWDTTAINSIGSDNTEVRAENGCIIAPEGSQIFTTTGASVKATNLRSGIYLVRTPDGKTVKVAVR